MEEYSRGFAFIVEGATEKVFYSEYVLHVAHIRGISVTKVDSIDFVDFVLEKEGRKALVKFRDVGTVSQMPNAGAWFQRACLRKYGSTPWHVFLAYDTDEYNCPITKFHDGDWAILRNDLQGAETVTDLAANADIEDVMLCDLEGVLRFLGLPLNTPLPRGGKGKSKMKKLHRKVAPYNAYHAGTKSRDLVRALDFDKLTRLSPVPLTSITEAIMLTF